MCYCNNVDVGIILARTGCGIVFTIPVSPTSMDENMGKFWLPHFANPVCNGKSISVMVWAFGELVVPSDIVDVLSIALIMLETPRAAGCCAACPSQAAAEDLVQGRSMAVQTWRHTTECRGWNALLAKQPHPGNVDHEWPLFILLHHWSHDLSRSVFAG